MAEIEKVIKGLYACTTFGENGATDGDCKICPYEKGYKTGECWVQMNRDALELLEEQQDEHKRLVSWLSKFCRHIDNGDKWLTDEENIKFFREKMKQQFGWDNT